MCLDVYTVPSQRPTGQKPWTQEGFIMNKFDCDRFVRGAEEIDRKRAVIKRVITTTQSLLNKDPKDVVLRYKPDQVVFQLFLGTNNLSIAIIRAPVEGGLWIHVLGTNNEHLFRFGNSWENNTLPLNLVPAVYLGLSRVIEDIHHEFPWVGIAEHFDFFCEQVDA